MNQSKNLLNSKDSKKDYELCINYVECKGKWFKYKSREDNGFCKTCLKTEIEKEKGIKKDSHFN